MATLFEKIQAQLANKPKTPQPEQAGISKLLRAKNGKVGGAGPIKASSLGEAAAIGEVQGAQAQQAAQGQLVGMQLGQQQEELQQQGELARQRLGAERRIAEGGLATAAQATREQRAGAEAMSGAQLTSKEKQATASLNSNMNQAITKMASDRKVQENDLFEGFRQSNQELAFRKDAADLEQLGFQLALRDKDYVQQIQSIGKTRDLEDKAAFREESYRLAMGDQTKSLLDKIGFNKMMDASDRDFEKMLANMGVDAKMQILQSQIEDANRTAVVNGVMGAGKEVGTSWYKSPEGQEFFSQFNEQPPTDELTASPSNSEEAFESSIVGQDEYVAPTGRSKTLKSGQYL